MGIIKDTEYYNKTITRIAIKSRELLPKDITLIEEAYSNNSRDVIYEYALKNKVLPFIAKLLCNLNKMAEKVDFEHFSYVSGIGR